MNILITGASGMVGGAMLRHCLEDPSISSITALVRRDLPITHPKLSTLIINDFSTYPSAILEKIASADGMIWFMGTYASDPDVNLHYPIAFQHAMLSARAGRSDLQTKRFRFVLLGGALVEPDQAKSLWFYSECRKVKGVAQTKTLEFAEEHKDVWQAFVIKPAGIWSSDAWAGVKECVPGEGMTITPGKLSAFVADLVVNGPQGDEGVILHKSIVERGSELLEAKNRT